MSTHARTTGRMPDFVLLGAMKSGTTTLHEYLDAHPGIWMSTPKEPQFFSRDHVYARGFDWYRGLFAGARADQVCGEASTCYTRFPYFGDVAAKVREHLPDARFLYLMRHPVERAYSHYRHLMQERSLANEPVLSFERALDEIPEIVDTSLYLRQLETWFARYPRERFHLIVLDDLERDPATVLLGVQEFLGVAPHDLVSERAVVANQAGTRIPYRRMDRMLARARQLPLLSSVVDAIPRDARRRARAWIAGSKVADLLMRRKLKEHAGAVSRLEPATRAKLLARYAESTRELEAFLGRRLPNWSR